MYAIPYVILFSSLYTTSERESRDKKKKGITTEAVRIQ